MCERSRNSLKVLASNLQYCQEERIQILSQNVLAILGWSILLIVVIGQLIVVEYHMGKQVTTHNFDIY